MTVTSKQFWIVGRVVYGAGLENQRTERFRGFESYTIRQNILRGRAEVARRSHKPEVMVFDSHPCNQDNGPIAVREGYPLSTGKGGFESR